MKTVENNNVKIAYSEAGNGETTLLFVHGSFINKEYWDEQVEHFSPFYHVVAVDLGGHGQSGNNRSEWTIEEFGNDVISVIKSLNLTDVILIGHSMGGDIILEVADKLPQTISGIIAIDNFKNAGTELPSEILVQIDQILSNLQTDFSNTSEAYARQALLTPQTDSTIANRVVADYRNANPDMGAAAVASVFSYAGRERELMQRLKFKMYLINVDYFPTNEETLRKYAAKGYELISMHGTCHFPMIEMPEELNYYLQGVIKEIKG